MIGAILGDMAGSIYEFHNIKTKAFPLLSEKCTFTDDSLMTIAVAQALEFAPQGGADFRQAVTDTMRTMGREYPYPMGGYGGRFAHWLRSDDPKPYGSFGNGSAMRVSPCGDKAGSLHEALELAKLSAEVTHDHPEGIKGAQAVAAAIYLARTGWTKDKIRAYIEHSFYPLCETVDEIRPHYTFNETCQGTVPQAITAFLESESFADALRTAVSLGGDSDTLACITGSIAWPYYARNGIDDTMRRMFDHALELLPKNLAKFAERWEGEHHE